MQEQAYSNISEKNDLLIKHFETELITLNEIMVNVEKTKSLRPSYVYIPLTAMDIINELKTYNVGNDFVSEIMIYFREEDRLYSSLGSHPIELTIPNIYEYSLWKKSDFLNEINNCTERTWHAVENIPDRGKMITVLYPIPINSLDPYATVMILISEKALLNMGIRDIDSNSVIYMTDKYNNILYTNDNHNLIEITSLKTGSEKDNIVTASDGRDYYFSLGTTFFDEMSIIMMYPKDLIKTEIIHQIFDGIWLLITLMLLSIIIAVTISYYNYKPIKNLRDFASNINNNKQFAKSEIDLIVSILGGLKAESDTLSKTVDEAKNAMFNTLMREVLLGNIKSVEEFNSQGVLCGATLEEGYFCVAILNFLWNKNIINNDELVLIMNQRPNKWLPDGYKSFAKTNLEPGKAIILLSFQETSGNFDQDIKYIYDNLKYLLGCNNVYMGVSDITDDICKVNLLYATAKNQVDKAVLMEESILRQIPAASDYMEGFMSYPKEELFRLQDAMDIYDVDKIREVGEKIFNDLKKTSRSYDMILCICHDVVGMILHLKNRLNASKKYDEFSWLIDEEIIAFKSIYDVHLTLQKVCRSLEKIFGQSSQEKGNDVKSIIEYINENYCRHDFSVGNMSKYFNTSSSNLTHYFKSNTGQTISNYVNNLRIEKAKELLIQKTYNLAEIVERIGYYDTSSFIKKFKSATGMTPIQYRKSKSNNL
jgi:AraC-like DNA-binding protein